MLDTYRWECEICKTAIKPDFRRVDLSVTPAQVKGDCPVCKKEVIIKPRLS